MRSTPALISSYIIHVQARASSKTPHSNHSNQTMTYPFLLSTLQFWFRYNEKSPHHVARLHRFRHDSGKSLSQFSSFSFVQMPSSIDQLLLLRFAFRYRQRGFRFFFSVRLFSILTSCGKVICRWQLERGKVRMVERGRKGCSHKTARNIAHASHNRLCNWGGDGIKIEIERYNFFGALGRVWLVTSHGALYYFPLYFGCRLFYCKQK